METLDQPKISTNGVEAEISTLPQSLSNAYRSKMGKLLELSKDQKDKLKKWLKKRIEEWKEDTTDLRKRLAEDLDLVESVVYETDFPWTGASNVHVQVTEIYMDVYRSVFDRSILGADMIWTCETDLDELRDVLADVEEAMNYKARNEWNIDSALKGAFWTTSRDGLGIVQATWAEEYEKVNDIAIIGNIDDFRNEFPSPEESGISVEEYMQLAQAAMAATDDNPLEIPITYEKQKYHGVKYDVINRIDFVTIPAWVPDIKSEDCRGYGKIFTYNKETVRKKISQNVFYEEEGKDLLKKDGNSRGENVYYESTDWINGIRRTNRKNEYELYELVIKVHLDGLDKEAGKYLVTYSQEHDVLLSVMEYYYRADMYALFRIDSRPNSLDGKSVPQKTRDMNDEIDTQHNQRINARTITSVPTFKAHSDIKQDPLFDPEAAENKWKPGRIFYSSKPELFEQFKVQPVDLGESLQEESNDMKILDLRLGSAASLLSGGVASGDPSAPGNKTAMMIQQSNLRMDDPLNELRHGVSELGDISMSHYYQFGAPLMSYQTEKNENGVISKATNTISKKYLRQGLHLKMKGVTVVNNPDAEMQRLIVLYQQLMTVPEFQNNPEARVTLWRDALRAGRIQGRDNYMPTLEEVQQQQIEMQKAAMIQMEQEKAAQEAQAKAEMIKQNLSQAKQEIDIRNTAAKMAENALGPQPESGVSL